jgi:hypothetical protein
MGIFNFRGKKVIIEECKKYNQKHCMSQRRMKELVWALSDEDKTEKEIIEKAKEIVANYYSDIWKNDVTWKILSSPG